MATKEENQLLINEFVTRNASTINNLESAKQKAVLDAIILIQNKFGTINQTTFKNDVEPKPKRVKSSKITTTTTELPFKVGDKFTDSVNNIHTILEINPSKDYFEFEFKGDKYNGFSIKEAEEKFRKKEWNLVNTPETNLFKFEIGDTFQVVSNQSTWTIIDIVKDFDEYIIKNDDNQTNTSIRRELLEEDVKLKRLVKIFVNQPVTTSTSSNNDQEIMDLEEAIDTQKLLLTLADTKEEKEEIKSLLKDLRVQLKKLKK